MASFGWAVGLDACDYLGDADEAYFACYLGMPWARQGAHWSQDPAGAPQVSQADCQQFLAQWLAPWSVQRVDWELWGLSGGAWARLAATRLESATPPASASAALLRAGCADRLHGLVRGHSDALGFMAQGNDDSPLLSYPIVSPGVAQLATPVSECVLGASQVMRVMRTQLAAVTGVVALPVFDFGAGPQGPAGQPVTPDPSAPGLFEFPYAIADTAVNGQIFSFAGCVVEARAPVAAAPAVPPRLLTLRAGVPDAQLRARVSRELYPLRLWLEALDPDAPGNLKANQLCATFLALAGGGEDELDAQGAVVGSIFEVLLTPDEWFSAFQVRDDGKRQQLAARLAKAFTDKLAADAGSGAWAGQFYSRLAQATEGCKLPAEVTAAATAMAMAATSGATATKADLLAARALSAALCEESAGGRAAWCCWFAGVALEVLPANQAAALGARLRQEAADSLAIVHRDPRAMLSDDVLRIMNGQIDYMPGFWEVIHSATDLAAAVADAANERQFVDGLLLRLQSVAPARAKLEASYKQAAARLARAQRRDHPEAADPPLQLRYSSAQTQDNLIRGCILALRAGYPDAGTVRWQPGQWLTSFHARVNSGGMATIVKDAAGQAIVFSDTEGGTSSDGLVEQVCAYDGKPLHAADPAPEMVQQRIVPAVPEVFEKIGIRGSTPPLAPGIFYSGLCGTCDNTGVVIEQVLRGARAGEPTGNLPASLFDSPALDPLQEGHYLRYLSRQVPARAVFSGHQDFGVGEETMAFEVLRDGAETATKVAVLFDGSAFRAPCPAQEIRLAAPAVQPGFLQRWLAADLMVPAGHVFRWSRVANLSPAALDLLVAAASDVSELPNGRRALGLTHPAVMRLDLRVTWYDPTGKQHRQLELDLPLRHLAGGTWLRDEGFVIDVHQGSPAAASKVPGGGTVSVRVDVPPGMRARLDVTSVLDPALLSGDSMRLMESAFVQPATADLKADPSSERPFHKWNGEFRSRKPEVLWVESLPPFPAVQSLPRLRPEHFVLQVPESTEDPAHMHLALDAAAAVPAQWISRFLLEQKRWQWSGYQVDFPDSPDLKSWLPLYAGTTNEMPRLPGGRFTSALGAQGWRLAGLAMEPVPLPRIRPAWHLGAEITPVLRFASLLRLEVRASLATAFVYKRLHGRTDPFERVLPPVWEEAIPLPRGPRTASGGGLGNLLVLQDAMYDTGDQATFGGIAERLDLDVVSTWVDDVQESGPNPLFHGNEPLPGLRFELEQPFGLGYDRVVGGRPAQTGVVVRPHGSQGRWVMAKCRLRRLLLPEWLLDAEFSVAGATRHQLRWRMADEEWVPQDFVLYVDAALSSLAVNGTPLRLPDPTGLTRRAYLVTWHKDRWTGATPTWRPQVNLYERSQSRSHWALRARRPCHTQADFAAQSPGDGRLLVETGTSAVFHHIQVSDYTEPRWLTFIGSFSLPQAPHARDFQLRGNRSALVLEPRASGVPMPVLRPHSELCASLLLLYAPVVDVMRGSFDAEGGELVGVYGISGSAGEAAFDLAVMPCHRDLRDCHGVVIQLQRINVTANAGNPLTAGGWGDMVGQLFPGEGTPQEATLRFLPEYLAPLSIAVER